MLDSSANRTRHVLALCFALVSLCLSIVAYLYLGFDESRTVSYGVAAYLVLTALNFRTMFKKRGRPLGDDEKVDTQAMD